MYTWIDIDGIRAVTGFGRIEGWGMRFFKKRIEKEKQARNKTTLAWTAWVWRGGDGVWGGAGNGCSRKIWRGTAIAGI